MKRSIVLFAIVGLVQTGLAAVISPVSVISSSQGFELAGRVVENVLNGVEMNDGGDPDSPAAWSMNAADDVVSAGEGWMANNTANGKGPWLIIDLGAVTNLGTISIWNFNPSAGNYITRASKDISVYIRTTPDTANVAGNRDTFDPTGWTNLDDITLTQNPGGTTISSPNGILAGLGGVEARYVAIEISATYGPSIGDLQYAALGEVQFFTGNPVVVDPFPAIADGSELIVNGGWSQTTNETVPSLDGYRVTGSLGDYVSNDGKYADVVGWTHYHEDPNNLGDYIDTGEILDGTDKMVTNIRKDQGRLYLHSTEDYRNGMVQMNILNGLTINPSVSYNFVIDVAGEPTTDLSLTTFTAALTQGSGTAATNLANIISGMSLTVTPATNLPSSLGTPYSIAISGTDLLAAQSTGQVNILFESLNTDTIDGFPEGPIDLFDYQEMSRIYVGPISLSYEIPFGDVNKDGVVDTSDVNVASSYLDGSVDGGDDAATRQAELVSVGFTAADALVYLNLTQFDIDGDDDFDADDITALQALTISYASWASSKGLTEGVNDGYDDDAEAGGGDGVINLVEYALGGDPLADDAADILPKGSVSEDGNWFYHVHSERLDPSLTYTLQICDNLVLGAWSTSGIEFVGESGAAGTIKSVTNRTDVGSAEFIHLEIQKD